MQIISLFFTPQKLIATATAAVLVGGWSIVTLRGNSESQRGCCGLLHFALMPGLIGGFTALSVKTSVEIVKAWLLGHHQSGLPNGPSSIWECWQTYCFLGSMPFPLLLQLWCVAVPSSPLQQRRRIVGASRPPGAT